MLFDDEFDEHDDVAEEGAGLSLAAHPASGLKPPRASSYLSGHENIERAMISLINKGAMPHAVIFTGPKGIGKATFAFRLARHLIKHGTAGGPQEDLLFGGDDAGITSLSMAEDDPVFSKVSAGGHPDLLTIEKPVDPKTQKPKTEINVETARKVAPFLRMTSAEGGWRVVIIDDADTMNRNAQNALLKILEEPPKNALLIMVTHRLGAMIPTIRSRCRAFAFDALSAESFGALLDREYGAELSADEKQMLAALSDNSIGHSQSIVENKTLDTARTTLDLLSKWPDINFEAVHHLSENAGRAGQDAAFDMVDTVFSKLCYEAAVAKARGGHLPQPFEGYGYQTLLNDFTLEEWLALQEKLRGHFSQARYANLDKRLAILTAFHLLKN
jgi:DNA polymerase-3 subunit delta'